MAFPPHSLAPSQLARLLGAERDGQPFLAYKDSDGELQLEPLLGRERITLGRGEHNAITLGFDPEVSRTHAQLELVGDEWTVVDDGLSRNGSFVNGERLAGRRRLADGDMLRLGRTSLLFRCPVAGAETTIAADPAALVQLSAAQKRVLVALCRPLAKTGEAAIPASNREIAAELNLSLDGVKTQIRALFATLGIDELPQYRKRTELARRALDLGLVSGRDLNP
jgi:DNA-binding CsgD family transcriptional regulator